MRTIDNFSFMTEAYYLFPLKRNLHLFLIDRTFSINPNKENSVPYDCTEKAPNH